MSSPKKMTEEDPLPQSRSVQGRQLTTMGVGGSISQLYEPGTTEELSSTLRVISEEGLEFRVIGAGSNLIIPDEGVTIPVIKLGRGFRWSKQIGEHSYRVGGAMPLMPFAREVAKKGLSGLEFAAGIPASIGGALRMNAGAHGGEMSEVVKSVTYLDRRGELHKLDRSSINFSYRETDLPKDAIIVEAELSFSKDSEENVSSRLERCLNERLERQPLRSPSSGSVFTNPAEGELTAGEIIERASLKGRAIGGAKISEKHGNWIVNEEKSAKAFDVVELVELVQKEVKEQFGITLKPEIVLW